MIPSKFKVVLNRKGQETTADFQLLSTRFKNELTYEEKLEFDNAVYLSGYNDTVKKVNNDKLERLKFASNSSPVPITEVCANHNCLEADQGSTDDASGLEKKLLLGPSCKIVLRHNLWTETGLVNGAVGALVDIVYLPGKKPPHNRPAVLMCQFDNYKVPYLRGDSTRKLVPIPAISKSWTFSNDHKCTMVQFPIQITYAMTIHRCQGLTLPKVCM
ncbi:hypothetical protein FOCC_FOCC014551 [Frankliniella occidentalis]|nr:hypothetical protein FOCC_FOCC014551 [Frankliniella occidentalis]